MDTLLLVLPPQHGLLEGFSSGLLSLANYVSERTDVDVRVIDFSLVAPQALCGEIDDLVQSSSGRLFVGITTTTASYQSGLRVARTFKSKRPDAVLVLGGHHAAPEAAQTLKRHSEIDCVIRGEGEVALLQLLSNYPDLGNVSNLVYRGQSGLVANAAAPLLTTAELDKLPPFFAGTTLHSAPGKFNHVTYVSARGCPLKCSFCAVANETIRAKSVSAVVRDLRQIVATYGPGRIAIEDNFFAHSPRRTFELCGALEQVRTDATFTWDCQTRVESARSPEVCRALARAGCDAVYLGVEAFDPDALRYLGKTLQPASYVRTLEQEVLPQLLDAGMACYLNLQFGLPGDSPMRREVTLRSLEALGRAAVTNGSTITIFPQLHVIYPGTRLWQDVRHASDVPPLPTDLFEDFTAWEADAEPILRWLGKRFAHGTGGIPIGILDNRVLRNRSERDRFVVDPECVFRVEAGLDDVAMIPGIEVFKYSRFLTGSSEAQIHGANAR